ncbi:MAG TPA: hypothetical protein VEW06_04155 [Xanthobacteraceae bacterium]|jgi:hypothetical protein|nr:hypothetical protein [Xanthobacteraceae bacterium]
MTTKTLFVAAAMLLAATVAQAMNLFDEEGNRIGMTTETRDVTTFYDVCGDKVGTWRTINGRNYYYDARGKRRNGVALSANKLCK